MDENQLRHNQKKLDSLFEELKDLTGQLCERFEDIKPVANITIVTDYGTASLYLPLQEQLEKLSQQDKMSLKAKNTQLVFELEIMKQSLINSELNYRFKQLKQKVGQNEA